MRHQHQGRMCAVTHRFMQHDVCCASSFCRFQKRTIRETCHVYRVYIVAWRVLRRVQEIYSSAIWKFDALIATIKCPNEVRKLAKDFESEAGFHSYSR